MSTNYCDWKPKLTMTMTISKGGVEDTRLEVDDVDNDNYNKQRWSRGHEARGQGHKKNPRPRTALPRTDPLEAKDRNARGQGQGPRTQAQVFAKKKGLQKNFPAISKKSSKIFSCVLQKKRLLKFFFQAIYKISTIQKKVLSSSRGQGNFRGLEAKAKDFKMCPRESPRGQGRPRGLLF